MIHSYLLDGVFRNQVIHSDILVLSNMVGTVSGLLLDGGVPSCFGLKNSLERHPPWRMIAL
jgi:hypothetical protein